MIQNINLYLVLGALLGTQSGREVEIVNTFELAVDPDTLQVDHEFLVSRRDQCKQGMNSYIIGAPSKPYGL